MQNDIVIEQVKSFSPEVVETIRKLAKQIGENYKELTDKDVEEMLASPHTHLFFARDSKTNQIAGMVTVLVVRIPYIRKAHIEDVVVDKTYRNQGIGTLLLQKAVAVGREKGAAHVDFSSRPRRAEGNSMYEKLGFQKRETNIYRKIIDYAEV